MLHYITYLVFIISVAMAAGGIILSSRLRNRNHNEIFSALLYFQVFIFTFGFYGIWGQILVKAYLTPYISADLLVRITDISRLLGFPFLVFAWLMLIRLSCGLSGRICSNWFVFGFLILNFTAIVFIGYKVAGRGPFESALLLRICFIAMNLIYAGVSALLSISVKRKNSSSVLLTEQLLPRDF